MIEFPTDLAIRNKRTLRELVLINQGTYHEYDWRLIKLLQSLQHLKSKEVVWKKVTFTKCHFGNLYLDGGGDRLTDLVIDQVRP